MKTFACRLEELLERGAGNGGHRWSKEGFAGRVGIHSDTLRNWRQGRTVPATPFLLEACISALDLDIETANELRVLAGRSGTKKRQPNHSEEEPLSERFESIWSGDRSEFESIELCKSIASNSIIPGLLYLEHRVEIDIKNPEGDADFVFWFDAVNISNSFVLGESKSIWIENGGLEASILPTRSSYRLMRIEMRRNYPHMKQFFCAFSNAVEPGGRISYGYETSVSKMFTAGHYWDTKINNLTRRVLICIKHNKGKELMNAYVESETSDGVEQEARSNLQFKTDGDIPVIVWNKWVPKFNGKYSISWCFED